MINKNLRNILIHKNWTLNKIFGQIINLNGGINLPLFRRLGRLNLIGLNLLQTILAPQIPTQPNQMSNPSLQLSSHTILKIGFTDLIHFVHGTDKVILLEMLPYSLT
jgi:hypothetical protein